MPRNDWVGLENLDPRGIAADGLTLATFTTSAPVFPVLALPANFWRVGRMMHIRARGRWGATGTPTMTWRLQNTVGTVVTLATGAAVTLSALTNQAWELDAQIQCRAVGTAGSLYVEGDLYVYGAAAPAHALPATGTAPAAVTVDTTIGQAIGVEVASSVSNAANTVKGTILEVLSVN